MDTELDQSITGARRMLAPVAYSEAALPALKLARSSRFARRIGNTLFAILVLGTLVVAFSPWQQSVKGTGQVIAYAPLNRQQVVGSPVKGRLVRLGPDIYENVRVARGQLIAEISDIDPEYLQRLQAQADAAEQRVAAAQTIVMAAQRKLEVAQSIVASYQNQLDAYIRVKEQIVAAADAMVEAALNKRQASQQELIENEAALEQIQADFHRQKLLYSEGIASQLKFQEAERKYKEALAKVAKARAYLEAAENDLVSKRSDRNAKEQKAQVDIDYATAALRKANADVAAAESDLAKAQAELNKSQQEALKARTAVARQQNQLIYAPCDGFITRIPSHLGSQILKEGDPICVIVPDTADRAAQIWLDGNDAPLVEPGRHVRLQFEGWPAIQFAGWPSVAVGTFGGTVVSVDSTDDGLGKFRVLVLPDESQQQWPSQRFLRQGVRANGWVLLERVPLWYEIWRNMNGFPP
ncbi:MAG: toxin secretion protein, partial [Planctomycetota bacterium]